MHNVKIDRRIACLRGEEAAPPEAVERLWEALGAHTPAVERDASAPALFYLDAVGVAPRYGSEAAWGGAVLAEARLLGIEARLGLAESKFAARLAAGLAQLGGPRIITEPDARFLAPLPVESLPLTVETLRRLRVLGLHTLSKLSALPGVAVAEQFGAESLVAWRWARGQDERLVAGRRCQIVSASREFDAPEARQEGLLAMAVRLAEQALRDLPVERRTWALRWVKVEARTAEGESLAHKAWLGEAAGQETVRALLGRMVGRLRSPESEGVVELTVTLWGLEPAQGRQLMLMEEQETDLRWQQVAEIIRRRYPDGLLRPVAVDLNAPILAERYALAPWPA